MKKILLILLCFSTEQILAQDVNDFGKSFYVVKNIAYSNFGNTCDGEGKILMYCVSDGSKVNLLFRNNKFSDLQLLTPYSSKSIAELELEKQIKEFASEQKMNPYYSNGKATFTTPEIPIAASFDILEFNRTFYVRMITQYKPLLNFSISK